MTGHRKSGGFTLAEMLIALAASVLVVGALLAGSIGLHHALHASEIFADHFSDQRRIIDYVSRDLRRSVGIAARDAAGTDRELAGETLLVSTQDSLVVSLPGYYESNVPADENYDAALSPVATEKGPDYGDASGAAPPVTVVYRQVTVAEENCVCLVREEAGVAEVIVRDAEEFILSISVSGDGRTAVVQGAFAFSGSRATAGLPTRDLIMLRNSRIDAPP